MKIKYIGYFISVLVGLILIVYGYYLLKNGQDSLSSYILAVGGIVLVIIPMGVSLIVEKFGEDKQNKLNEPLLNISIGGYTVGIYNSGRYPAEKIKIVYTEDSTPKHIIDCSTVIEQDLAGGDKIYVNLEESIISVLNRTKQLFPEQIEGFLKGENALIPKFYVRYEFNGKEFKSDEYFIGLSYMNGKTVNCFGSGKL